MKKYTFNPDTLTACGPSFPEGRTFPARYQIQDAADMKRGQAVPVVHIFAVVDEKEIKIDVPGDDEWYLEAFKAATEAAEQIETEQAETVEEIETETQEAEPVELEQIETEQAETVEDVTETEQAEPVELEQTETQEAETMELVEAVEVDPSSVACGDSFPPRGSLDGAETQEAEPVELERKPAGDKSFIGTVIEGECYRIVFDSETQRTRVFIPAEYREAARQTVEGAGFYWSKNMESFNKKLTCKAYRAAVALAAELDKIVIA